MQADNPADGSALEAGGATSGRGLGVCVEGIDADCCSFPLSVSEHVICSRPSLNHAFTRSLTHSLIHSVAHSLTHCSTQTGRHFHISCKITTLPPFGRTHPSPGQDDVPLEKWLHRTISDTHPVSLIYKSSLGEKKDFFLIEKRWIRVEGWCTFAWPDLAISLSESLPLRACYWDTAISQVLGTHSEIVLLGEIELDWSPKGRVIIRYDQ